MENENKKQPSNGLATPSEGTVSPKSKAQGDQTEIKEGDPSQQRPQHGADAGKNTSTREDQLPSLNDGATPQD